jgi:hypothetical protein
MRSTQGINLVLVFGALTAACGTDGSDPLGPALTPEAPSAGPSWEPAVVATADLEVILRGEGFGLVKFRQPKDAEAIIFLDTWVRDLAPNTEYLLQRAVDATVDNDCTSTAWLTLGKGLQPQSIVTDAQGVGRAELFRDVSAIPPGSEFDIQFRVIDALTQAVVLQGDCYQYRVTP